MLTRRDLGKLTVAGLSPQTLFAQNAAVQGAVPANTVWLNANENPEGPPPEAREAIARAIAVAGRYNHRVFPELNEVLAASVDLNPDQVIPGAGSTEVLHCAIDAFTSVDRPLITAWPTWEMVRDLAAASGRSIIKVPLTTQWSADVERMAGEAKKAGGGVIHLGNPNNPTSSITPKGELRWLAEHLPPHTVLLIDEAYVHFVESQEAESAIAYVREGRSVIATRTFSKLYGMAGVRVGFGSGRADLLKRMQPFRSNVISILGARAAMAAIQLGDGFVAERRARRNRIRAGVCAWLDQKGVHYFAPHANFVLMDIGQNVQEAIPRMLAQGVAVGRRFDSLDTWMRVAMGTEEEMAKFRAAFEKVVLS
jgi:histidinol-phosphate aminotransferase